MGAGGAHYQLVAIRRRLGDHRRAERPACAAPVLDHERLAELRAELLRHDARDDVGGAAGRKRHHQPDRLGGIGLRQRAGCPERRSHAGDERLGLHVRILRRRF
jgi:hypothetical protein